MDKTEDRLMRKYSIAERIAALKMLQANGMNYSKTSRELNISVGSLLKWEKMYGKDVLDNSKEIKSALQVVNNEQKKHIATFMKRAWDVKMQAIERAKKLLMMEEDLNRVVNLLKYLDESIEKTMGVMGRKEAEQTFQNNKTYVFFGNQFLPQQQKELSNVQDVEPLDEITNKDQVIKKLEKESENKNLKPNNHENK